MVVKEGTESSENPFGCREGNCGPGRFVRMMFVGAVYFAAHFVCAIDHADGLGDVPCGAAVAEVSLRRHGGECHDGEKQQRSEGKIKVPAK